MRAYLRELELCFYKFRKTTKHKTISKELAEQIVELELMLQKVLATSEREE